MFRVAPLKLVIKQALIATLPCELIGFHAVAFYVILLLRERQSLLMTIFAKVPDPLAVDFYKSS